MCVVQNQKQDILVRKQSINAVNAKTAHTKETVSKGITVKHFWKNGQTPMEERHKVLSVAKTFLKYRKEDLERILSDEGIHLRTNRSIQVEGSFGELKQDMQFRRYLSRGTSNVLAESILLAMAKNVNKLHNKIQKGKTGKHLFPLKTA